MALNPRINWDNLGTMALFHRQHIFPGDAHGLRFPDFKGWDEMEDCLYKEHDAAVVLPVFMHNHSGITIQTGPFSCSWDSGQIGFIWVSKEKARHSYGRQHITAQLRQRIVEALEAEIKVYGQYLTGDVWGFVIETEDGQQVDSCWGFFGEDKARAEGVSALMNHCQLT